MDFGFSGTIELNSPLSKEDWDKITDVELDKTQKIWFSTPSGKEVAFIPLSVIEDIRAEIEETKAEIIKVIRTQNRKNLIEYVNGLNVCLCIIDSKMHMSAE